MLIGGIQKLSLVDYPGKTAISLYTIGCNMRCGFCHNKELVVPECFTSSIDTDKIINFLKSRIGLVEAVVVSGGEPCLHPDLPDFIRQIKKLGYLVKLDTNGTKPEMLKKLLDDQLLDFVAMDIKAPLHNYEKVTNRPVVNSDIEKSIQLIKSSGLEYEFRTTIVKSLHQVSDFTEIGKLIANGGKAKRYALQRFQPAKTLDPAYKKDQTLSETDLLTIENIMQSYADTVIVH